jgi:ethanolamine utilization microcompartment shell protein EutS
MIYFEVWACVRIPLLTPFVTRMSVTLPGFRVEIGFVDHFATRLVIILDYSAIADFDALRIDAAHVRSFQSTVSPPGNGF